MLLIHSLEGQRKENEMQHELRIASLERELRDLERQVRVARARLMAASVSHVASIFRHLAAILEPKSNSSSCLCDCSHQAPLVDARYERLTEGLQAHERRLAIGGAGAGKTTGVVSSALLSASCSLLNLDPKGENARIGKASRGSVYVLDASDPIKVSNQATVLHSLADLEHSRRSSYWANGARMLLSSMIANVVSGPMSEENKDTDARGFWLTLQTGWNSASRVWISFAKASVALSRGLGRVIASLKRQPVSGLSGYGFREIRWEARERSWDFWEWFRMRSMLLVPAATISKSFSGISLDSRGDFPENDRSETVERTELKHGNSTERATTKKLFVSSRGYPSNRLAEVGLPRLNRLRSREVGDRLLSRSHDGRSRRNKDRSSLARWNREALSPSLGFGGARAA